MITTKPYLIRAVHEWCSDQGFTPYLAVQVDESTRVPREFVRDGQIVLNVGLDATHQLLMGNEEISFQTRFNGTVYPVVVPVDAVLAIYARENGQGIAFDVESSTQPVAVSSAPLMESESSSPEVDGGTEPSPAPARKCSHLTRVK